MRYVLLALLFVPLQSYAFADMENATLVIGHDNFNAWGTIPGTPSKHALYLPEGLGFDKSGHLWVVDTGFNRILMFSPPFQTGASAKLVIGQPNFTSTAASLSMTGLDQPFGLAFDSYGNMWVADTNNNRIVEFKQPFRTGESSSLVIGSPSFDKGVYPTSARSLAAPYGLAFDQSGDLWAVDYYDDRVLEYVPPFENRMNASLVIGQPDFVSNSAGSTPNRTNLPGSIAFDSSGNLWLTDSLNNRILKFTKPFSTDESASLVLGQANFSSNFAGISNDSLNTPYGITFDKMGDLWATDGNNARVLEYVPPFADGKAASAVLGQANFEGMHSGTSANMLSEPYDIKVDGGGNLWVADTDNNRVLEFAIAPAPEFGPVAPIVLVISVGFYLLATSRSSVVAGRK